MNISKIEQRVLHALAQGGCIRLVRDPTRRVQGVLCTTRDGLGYPACDMALFRKLKRKRLIESRGGSPYRISRLGRTAVRARPDNR